MSRRLRAWLIIGGTLITLFGSIVLPWFVLDYTPPGGYYPRVFNFDLLSLVPYTKDIDSLKWFFIELGIVFLLGVLAFSEGKFLANFVEDQFLKWANITSLIVTVYTNVINKSIILHMNKSFLQTFYGVTDVSYIQKYSTLHLSQGFILTLLGTAISFTALNFHTVEDSPLEAPAKNVILALTVGSIVVCCGFSGFDAVHGLFLPENNNFFDNSHHVLVAATRGWQDTNVALVKGDVVYVLYVPDSGTWTSNKGASPYTDAQGLPASAASGLTSQPKLALSGFPTQSLIGKIGGNQPFNIGDAISFIAPSGGELSLRMNQRDAVLAQGAGTINVQISDARFASGVVISFNTVKVSTAAQWQDTNIKINSSDNDIIGISYVYGSGTWSDSNRVVAPTGVNGTPPSFAFMNSGNYDQYPLNHAGQGLAAKIGAEPAIYCGYSMLARSTEKQSTRISTEELYVGVLSPPSVTGTLSVVIAQVHQTSTVSAWRWV